MRLPALVEPGPPLSDAEGLRTARHTLLPELGEIGQRRLAAARVLVMGAGGLGAPVLQYLAAAGIGSITVVDDDVVDTSNLHRQVIHGASDVGRSKTASAAAAMHAIAPEVRVVERAVRLTEDNAQALLAGHDVVLDGTDTFATRYLVADTCASLGTPLVWGSILRFDGQVSVFWSRPPAVDGAIVRGVTLRDLFPQPPAPGEVPSCAEAGVLGALCGIVGSMMAVEAIKLIAGIGDVLLGRVAVVDALTMRVHDVPFALPAPSPTGLPTPAGPRESASPVTSVPRTPFEAAPLTPDALLVDVREPAEFAVDALPGAVNVPVSALVQAARSGAATVRALLGAAGVPSDRLVGTGPDGTGLADTSRDRAGAGLAGGGRADGSHDGTLATYCAAGIRSVRAARLLAPFGYAVAPLTAGDVARLRAGATPADLVTRAGATS